jgi:alpha-tubulin suppressor-like RCC1 family protein
MAACGDDNTMVVTDDGGLWSCGICHREGMTVDIKLQDFFGFVQVRFPGDAARIVTVTAGSDHTMALDADGNGVDLGQRKQGRAGTRRQ